MPLWDLGNIGVPPEVLIQVAWNLLPKYVILVHFLSRPDRYVPLFGEFTYDYTKWRESVPFAEQLRAFQELIEEGKVLQTNLNFCFRLLNSKHSNKTMCRCSLLDNSCLLFLGLYAVCVNYFVLPVSFWAEPLGVIILCLC